MTPEATIRAAFFVESDAIEGSSPAAYYRVHQYLPFLAANGVAATVLPSRPPKYVSYEHLPALMRPVAFRADFAARFLRRAAEVPRALTQDLVLIQRELFSIGPPVLERMLRRLNRVIVFDFDDAIWLASPGALRRVRDILALSRQVIAGNTYLAEFAARHNPNVTILPTSIDTDIYAPRTAAPAGDTLTVGWIGTPGNFEHLGMVLDPLREILARKRHVRFKVVSREPFRAPATVPTLFEPWERAREVRAVQGFDIGIMPLVDTPFTRGKCGGKALVCMSCGVPVVASPVGANSDIIQDGENGLLARTTGEWLEKLGALIDDAELRARLGGEGRRTIERRYSTAVNAPRLLAILRGAVDSSSGGPA
jgi:hypothetical protein